MRTPALAVALALLAGSGAAALAANIPAPSGQFRLKMPRLRGAARNDGPPADPSSFVADLPGADPSALPTADEWKEAPQVRLSHDVDACRAYRLREWVKIHCADFPASGASLLAGTRADVHLWVDPPRDPAETMATPRGAEIIFPVRRGDGRLFQVGQFGEGYDGPVAWNLAYTVSETWLEGERAPILLVR